MDILSPLPVQVDGEAWAQPPGTMTIKKLPDSATLLQGPNKVAYSRQPSKKDVTSQISLLQNVSSSGILYSEGLSSRRNINPPSPTTEQKSTPPE